MAIMQHAAILKTEFFVGFSISDAEFVLESLDRTNLQDGNNEACQNFDMFNCRFNCRTMWSPSEEQGDVSHRAEARNTIT